MSDRPHNMLDLCPRPLWVITSARGVRRSGLLATWVQPASLDDPDPMALCALAPHHWTTELIRQSGRCYLHLLRRDQVETALRFGRASGRDVDKFASLTVSLDAHGVPRLDDCLARAAGLLARQVDAGDRILMWVRLRDMECGADDMPLSDHEFFARLPTDVRIQLSAARQQDAERLRPLRAAWLEP